MKYAVIQTGGKQYKVSEGQKLKIEKIDSSKGNKVEFQDVLLFVDDQKVEVGKPKLSVKVRANIIEQIKGKKIDVFKYKAKTGYHKKTGHRQNLTEVQIDKIGV